MSGIFVPFLALFSDLKSVLELKFLYIFMCFICILRY